MAKSGHYSTLIAHDPKCCQHRIHWNNLFLAFHFATIANFMANESNFLHSLLELVYSLSQFEKAALPLVRLFREEGQEVQLWLDLQNLNPFLGLARLGSPGMLL